MNSMASMMETTQALLGANRGEALAAERLLPLVYNELRGLAGRWLRQERAGHTLQPTALVHEAYLRLIDQSRVDWQGRNHFLALAAQMMRRVLVDHARKKAASKRGGGQAVEVLSDVEDHSEQSTSVDVVALDQALSELDVLNHRQARVVELRYFGGMSVAETAQVLEVSERTVKGDWRFAKAWLANRLDDLAPGR